MPERASTDEQVAARALTLIGAKPLTSFSDGTEEAAAAAIIYEDVVAAAFTSSRWRFSIKQTVLNKIAEEPLGRWELVFQVPADCIQIQAVTVGDIIVEFERYQDRIYTDDVDSNGEQPVILDYQYRTPTSDWPPYFTLSVIHMLASELAVSVAQNDNLMALHNQLATTAFARARSVDSQGRTNQVLMTKRYIGRRFGGAGGR